MLSSIEYNLNVCLCPILLLQKQNFSKHKCTATEAIFISDIFYFQIIQKHLICERYLCSCSASSVSVRSISQYQQQRKYIYIEFKIKILSYIKIIEHSCLIYRKSKRYSSLQTKKKFSKVETIKMLKLHNVVFENKFVFDQLFRSKMLKGTVYRCNKMKYFRFTNVVVVHCLNFTSIFQRRHVREIGMSFSGIYLFTTASIACLVCQIP